MYSCIQKFTWTYQGHKGNGRFGFLIYLNRKAYIFSEFKRSRI